MSEYVVCVRNKRPKIEKRFLEMNLVLHCFLRCLAINIPNHLKLYHGEIGFLKLSLKPKTGINDITGQPTVIFWCSYMDTIIVKK